LDGVDENLDWVLTGQQVDDLKSLLHKSDGLHLLSGVPAVHEETANQALDKWALSLPELLLLPTASSVWEERLRLCRVD
jgi:hypothetical protein